MYLFLALFSETAALFWLKFSKNIQPEENTQDWNFQPKQLAELQATKNRVW